MDKELTTRQAAERLGESESLVRLWCQQGRFPGAHLVEHPSGDYWLIPASDLTSFVKPKPGPVPKAKPVKASGVDGHVNVKASRKGNKK
jgi:hypothetical protein